MIQKITIFLLSLAVFLSPLHAGPGLSKIVAKDDPQTKKLKEKQEIIALAATIFPVDAIRPIIYAYARSLQFALAKTHKISNEQESVEVLGVCPNGSLLCQSLAGTFDWETATLGRAAIIRCLDPATSYTETLRQWPVNNSTHVALTVGHNNRSFSTNGAVLLEIPSQPSEGVVEHHDHENAITTLLLLKNGNLLSASCDKTIKEWTLMQAANGDQRSLQFVRTYRGHTQAVCSLAQLPNGNFVSGSDDGTLREWTPGNRQAIRMFGDSLTKKQSLFQFLAAFPNGNVVSASNASSIALWNMQNPLITQQKMVTTKPEVASLAAFDDTHFLSGSKLGHIFVWHVDSPEPIQKLEQGEVSITCLTLARDRFFSGSKDGCVGEWVVDNRSSLETALASAKPQATSFKASTTAAAKS